MAEVEKGGLKSIADGRSDIFKIDPRKLAVKDGWNMREQSAELAEHIDMLAQSIAQIGVKEPLTVYWEQGKAYISDGHCRLAASIRAIEYYKAELKTVPVKTEDRYSSEAERVLSQLVRNSGKPLTAFEQSKVYKRLIDLGWQANEIGAKVGLSPARVSQILDLQTLPKPVQAMVVNGEVSASMAVSTVKAEGSGATAVLKDAVATAKAEGRKRAMPKDTGEPRQNIKTLVSEIFERVTIDDSGDMVQIEMANEDWQTLIKALKL